MITAETIYQKASRLDAFHLQEVADFIDFLTSKAKPADMLDKSVLEMDDNFWQPKPLSHYLQNRPPLRDITDLAADFWPEDESIDDFIAFVRQQRREDREQSQ